MIDLPTFGGFVATSVVMLVTPGPAVLYIVARAGADGIRAGVVSAAGMVLGGAVHVALAVFGVSAIVAASPRAFLVVQLAGAGYLVWLGVRVLRSASGAGAPEPRSHGRTLREAFWVNLLNPKSAVMLFAFLPQFVDPGRGPVRAQLLVLGGAFLVLALVSDTTYAVLAGSLGRRWGRSAGAQRRARIVQGVVYLALGLVTAIGAAVPD